MFGRSAADETPPKKARHTHQTVGGEQADSSVSCKDPTGNAIATVQETTRSPEDHALNESALAVVPVTKSTSRRARGRSPPGDHTEVGLSPPHPHSNINHFCFDFSGDKREES